mmetsp:Transcript_25156/g.36513  ORF Transcript_25156/g.36513 Transcript_25156/m.36513 type:complete len:83 (+) Transcript_25156:157-405(+)
MGANGETTQNSQVSVTCEMVVQNRLATEQAKILAIVATAKTFSPPSYSGFENAMTKSTSFLDCNTVGGSCRRGKCTTECQTT